MSGAVMSMERLQVRSLPSGVFVRDGVLKGGSNVGKSAKSRGGEIGVNDVT
jgi:hypothetical protein